MRSAATAALVSAAPLETRSRIIVLGGPRSGVTDMVAALRRGGAGDVVPASRAETYPDAYEAAIAVIVIFDVHSRGSFEAARTALVVVIRAVEEAPRTARPRLLLVGAKIDDVANHREVPVAEGVATARECGAAGGRHADAYVEASAHTGLHIAAVLAAARPPARDAAAVEAAREEELKEMALSVAHIHEIGKSIAAELQTQNLLLAELGSGVDTGGKQPRWFRKAAAVARGPHALPDAQRAKAARVTRNVEVAAVAAAADTGRPRSNGAPARRPGGRGAAAAAGTRGRQARSGRDAGGDAGEHRQGDVPGHRAGGAGPEISEPAGRLAQVRARRCAAAAAAAVHDGVAADTGGRVPRVLAVPRDRVAGAQAQVGAND